MKNSRTRDASRSGIASPLDQPACSARRHVRPRARPRGVLLVEPEQQRRRPSDAAGNCRQPGSARAGGVAPRSARGFASRPAGAVQPAETTVRHRTARGTPRCSADHRSAARTPAGETGRAERRRTRSTRPLEGGSIVDAIDAVGARRAQPGMKARSAARTGMIADHRASLWRMPLEQRRDPEAARPVATLAANCRRCVRAGAVGAGMKTFDGAEPIARSRLPRDRAGPAPSRTSASRSTARASAPVGGCEAAQGDRGR